MDQIKFKNLPKGFGYPVTKKEIRDWIKATNINAEAMTFSFTGTAEYYFSRNSTSSTHFVIDVTEVYEEAHWYFTMEIRGVKHERYEERREEISQALLSIIQNWVRGKLALSETTPKKPSRATLSFNLTEKDIVRLQEKAVFHPKGGAPGLLIGF